MADKASDTERGSRRAALSLHHGESTAAMDATDEERRVMALANELRISSAISPRELLSFQCNSPLESDDDIYPSEETAGEHEGGEAAQGEGGGGSGGEEDAGGSRSSDSSAMCVALSQCHSLLVLYCCFCDRREDLPLWCDTGVCRLTVLLLYVMPHASGLVPRVMFLLCRKLAQNALSLSRLEPSSTRH